MPHQCTQCGHSFPDGSKEMLSGCPDCGGNKFQFRPAAETDSSQSPSESAADSATPVSTRNDAPPTEGTHADTHHEGPSNEDLTAESGQRESDIEAGPPEPGGPDSGAPAPDESDSSGSDETADMAALRQELDDQFESIKILEPGQYELNLMELYNREEYIIALQEDGQYVIEVPETWLGD